MTQITEGAPVIEDGLRAVIQDEMQANNGWLPVRIASVNSAPSGSVRSVDVEPLIRAVIDGEPTALPRAFDVPIAWESSNGGASAITFPLSEGDTGRIQPAGGDISAWLANGTEQASDIEQGSFDLSDSIFKPDLRPFVALLQASAFSGTDIVISGPVQVGSNAATDFVALASKVLTELQAIKTAIETPHTHAGVTPGVGISGNGSIAGYTPGSVAAEKLRSL
jgi:hypothetical protein